MNILHQVKQKFARVGKKMNRSTTTARSSSSSNTSPLKLKGHRAIDDLIEKDYLRQKKIMLIVIYGLKLVLALVIIVALGIYLRGHYLPKHQAAANSTISFKVSSGQGVKEIARNLSKDKIISSQIEFLIYAKYKNKPLLGGEYRFKAHEDIKEVYAKLTKGTVNETKITIPEGWRREQIAQLLDRKGVTSYEAFMEASDGKEGQLFPDTYLLPKPTTASAIVKKMTDNYNLKTKDLGLTQSDLILASIVEREAKNDSDRPKVASVFDNRLAIGMKLQTDVTVAYAVDNLNLSNITATQIDDYKFWQGIKASQIQSVTSDYNTYKVVGLPPAPICNPGLASLEAAKHPADTDYLYFLSTDNGPIYFAKTLAEHNQNIQKYGSQ